MGWKPEETGDRQGTPLYTFYCVFVCGEWLNNYGCGGKTLSSPHAPKSRKLPRALAIKTTRMPKRQHIFAYCEAETIHYKYRSFDVWQHCATCNGFRELTRVFVNFSPFGRDDAKNTAGKAACILHIKWTETQTYEKLRPTHQGREGPVIEQVGQPVGVHLEGVAHRALFCSVPFLWKSSRNPCSLSILNLGFPPHMIQTSTMDGGLYVSFVNPWFVQSKQK